MSGHAGTQRPAVAVDELKRAWQALQAGQFRGHRLAPNDHPPATRRPAAPGQQAWQTQEPVLPIIGCAGRTGATAAAVAIATAAGQARVIECCTSSASGLAGASTAELGHTGDRLWARGTRGQVLLERGTTVMSQVGQVPPPAPAAGGLALSVLDIGWELAQVLSTPCWVSQQLRQTPSVIAVTAATIPGLRRLEGALTLLHGGTQVVAAVLGPRRNRWARGLEPSMGALTRALDRAGLLIELPEDRDLAVRGLDTASLPAPLLATGAHLLRLTGAGATEKGHPHP